MVKKIPPLWEGYSFAYKDYPPCYRLMVVGESLQKTPNLMQSLYHLSMRCQAKKDSQIEVKYLFPCELSPRFFPLLYLHEALLVSESPPQSLSFEQVRILLFDMVQSIPKSLSKGVFLS